MKKPLLVLGLVAMGAFALVRWMGDSRDGDLDSRLVFNRMWVDKLPTRPNDTANVFAALSGRERMGIFQAVSQWKGSYEIFKHTGSGDTLTIVYPDTGQKETVKVRVWDCDDGDMDYCLELKGASRGVKRYGSQDGWEIGAAATPDQLLERVAALARGAN